MHDVLRKIRPGLPEAKSEKADQKSSVYNVATQLKSIPAQISIWELLSTSEAHRESFIRVPRNAHVPEKTSPETMSQMIAQILAPKIITFSDDELSVEGRNHVRPLNITVRCNEYKVSLVLIDSGSGLNLCPLRT